MASNIVFSQNLKGYASLVWSGQEVFKRHSQIKHHLKQNLGEEFVTFLAEPQISQSALHGNDKANWMSPVFTANAVSLNQLPETEQANYAALLNFRLSTIETYIEELASSSNSNKKSWSALIKLAITIPDLSHVLVENNEVFLVMWGFSYKDQHERKPFSLRENLQFMIPPKEDKPVEPETKEETKDVLLAELTGQEHKPEENRTEETVVDSQNVKNEERFADDKEPTENEDNKTDEVNNKLSWWKKYWWKLLILLVLLLLILCLIFCRSCLSDKAAVLPDEPNQIVPIDTTKIVTDPDSTRRIVSDRLNVALMGDNTDINEFARQFKAAYPDEQYAVIYYDTLTHRVQLQIPAKEREKIKQELPKKLPDFEMLIWHESMFDHEYMPGDPGFGDRMKSWYHQKVKVPGAWDISRGDNDVVIAIIDDGFDLSHPEFTGKVYKPWNVMSRSPDVNTGRASQHGTHVAGIALALADNGQGVSGIAPGCKFMPVQVGDYNGNMSTTAVIDAVLYAIHNGADVVNMSLGMSVVPEVSLLPPEMQQAIIDKVYKEEEIFWGQIFDMAYENNVIFVLAAGNQNVMIGLDPMQRSDRTIKVSAVTPLDEKAGFSNFGSKSTISAPGVKIYSSLPGRRFDYMDGTSMAAPVVTGGIGLIKSINPAMSYDEIVDLIQSTGIPVRSPGRYVGNIIQLDVAANVSDRRRDKVPEVDCPEMQRKIDSLLQEIEKIRRDCPDSSTASTDTMYIPPEADDYTFAEGRWKSTTYLYNTESGDRVTIYFDFYTNGTGLITLVEPDGTECSAALDLALSSGQFIIDQKGQSVCSPPPERYNAYHFECEPDRTGCAECWARNKTDPSNRFKFHLVKIR